MLTKLPTELMPGDRLTSYDSQQRLVKPVTFRGFGLAFANILQLETDQGPLFAVANVPLEMEA